MMDELVKLKCQSKDCENDAKYQLLWTDEWVSKCDECAKKMVGLGDFMGYLVPRQTIRLIQADESDE